MRRQQKATRGEIQDARGAVALMVALLLVVMMGFAALAVDIGHLYVVRNELQNAADAGALAGARVLYSGSSVNAGANADAVTRATANHSESLAVEASAERGHWSHTAATFTENSSLAPTELWGVSTAALDANPSFINAVRVTASRQATPAVSFFARMFGYDGFALSADAVAYLGFAGGLLPGEADMPIAICAQALGNPYECSIGRMIGESQTAGWTDFTQCDGGATSTPAMRTAVDAGCSGSGANPNALTFGMGITTNNGEMQPIMNALRDCWWGATSGTTSWVLRLPVVDCASSIAPCNVIVGAVEVRVLWVSEGGTGQITVPTAMEGWGGASGWSNTSADPAVRWDSFRSHFNLQDSYGNPAPLQHKTIYFAPDCTAHDPGGQSGGYNFGILATIPKLVE